MKRSHTLAVRALAGALLLFPASAPAQQLTVSRILSAEFRDEGLPELEWLADGERFTYLARNPRTGAVDLVAERARTGERTVLVAGADLVPPGGSRPIEIEGYSFSADERRLLIYTDAQRVWRQATKGRYYVYDLASRRLTPVSDAPGWQMFAKFSPDASKVGFVRDNDLWVKDLATGGETRLTHDGSDVIINGTSDWVYEEELDLRDAWRWSPDGSRIAFWRFDQSPVQTFYLVEHPAGAYADLLPLRYPKAGSPNSLVRIGVVEMGGGETVWMETGDDAEAYLARMDWAASPDELVIQRLNRHQNRLDVLLADARTGRSRVLLTEEDSAWVDVDDDLTWLADGQRLLWSSERDGFNHLYLYDRDGKLVRQVTRGAWEVTELYGVDEPSGRVFFQATEEGPLERHLYRTGLDGSGLAQISELAGTHSADFAPGFRHFIHTYSSATTPPRISLAAAADGRRMRTLVDNSELAAAAQRAALNAPEFFRFATERGDTLHGYLIEPDGFDATRRYPALIHVYGGPGDQRVVDAWGLRNDQRYLWHQLLAERGYLIAAVDNRGTGARGRDFRKQTYLDLGRMETEDQIAAARHLASLPYVDGERIGIWGWSYGGYMTLLALLRGGDVFEAGISVAPVTDWRLYDTIYTERFMRTPEENPEGYRRSAPLTYADSLESELLLVHGTFDDNVHFQQTVQMTEAFQAAGEQFDLMIYPAQTHSIADRRLHLFELMTAWVLENL